MSWFPIAASVVGTIMQVSGKMSAARQAEEQGRRQQAADQYAANQAEQNAGQQLAAAQRHALDETRRARLMASRAIAVAGASGGGTSDPSVANLIADISGEGAYRRSIAIYQGEENARQMRMGAAGKLYEGEVAARGGEMQASALRTSALASGVSGVATATLYGKYGAGGPRASAGYSGYSGISSIDFDLADL